MMFDTGGSIPPEVIDACATTATRRCSAPSAASRRRLVVVDLAGCGSAGAYLSPLMRAPLAEIQELFVVEEYRSSRRRPAGADQDRRCTVLLRDCVNVARELSKIMPPTILGHGMAARCSRSARAPITSRSADLIVRGTSEAGVLLPLD